MWLTEYPPLVPPRRKIHPPARGPLFMLHVCMSRHVLPACPLHVHARPCMSIYCICPSYIFSVHVHPTCPCCISMLHVLAACPCIMFKLHARAELSMLHAHASCPCFMIMLHTYVVHAACPCCIVHAACTCCIVHAECQ